MDFITVLVTCPHTESERIAKKVLEKHLVACVNVIENIKSYYWWKGNLETDTESLLFMKTKEGHFESLKNIIEQIHPYENPEIIALPIIKGSEEYLHWIADETV